MDNKNEYIIIEANTDFYINTLSKCNLPIHSLILCINDDEKAAICASLANPNTKEIISLANFIDCDYISISKNQHGTRITYISKNKYKVSRSSLIFGTEFYYFTQLYFANIIDQNNVSLCCLAIECAKLLFGISYPMIAKGLGKAKPFYDIHLWSLAPTVLFYLGKPDFILPLRTKVTIITNENEDFSQKEKVLFCGDADFIEKIKEKLKK